MNHKLKVVSIAGTFRVIDSVGLKPINSGDIVELTNLDGSVDVYQAVYHRGSCSEGCCMYDHNKCIRWRRPHGQHTCILAYRKRGNFTWAFKDINQAIENL